MVHACGSEVLMGEHFSSFFKPCFKFRWQSRAIKEEEEKEKKREEEEEEEE